MKKHFGFTLAEVLITLGIIGVVAAITIPVITANITERVNSSRQANIAYKVTQAMNKMQSLGLLEVSYKSTDAFVDELQKHLNIAKRCDSAHIADCWPTQKVRTSDGKEFDVSLATTGKNVNLKSNKTGNVGLVLSDGAAIILTYNQDAPPINVGDPVIAVNKSLPVGFGKTKDFAYTTSVTSSIDFVMDVNGGKGPNSETIDNKYYDIRSFNIARFSDGCDGKVNGKCYVYMGTANWYDAVQICKDNNMTLPTSNELAYTIRDVLGFGKSSIPSNLCYWSSEIDYYGNSSKRRVSCFDWYGGYGFYPTEVQGVLCGE